MGGPGVAGNHDSRANVAIEMRRHDVPLPRLRADHGLRMADPRGGPQDERQVPAGGQFQRQQGKIVRLLGVGRFEHRHGRGHGKTAVVLFILAGRHARIVGRDDHQRPAGARVGRGKEGIGSHVQSDVLHRHQRGRAGHGHAEADFQGHLFVGGPLGTAAVGREVFEDLRRGRARIARAQRNAVIASGQGDRLIPAQQQPLCSRSQDSRTPRAPARGTPRKALD